MSFWGGFKTFAEKVGSELKKLFGAGGIEQTAVAVITYVAPLLETIVQLAAGSGAEALVAGVIKQVQADLATVSALVQGGTVTAGSSVAQSISTALGSVKDNLASLLADAHIKSSSKNTAITAAVTTIVGEVDALLGTPSISSAPAPATTSQPAAPTTQSK